MAGLSTQVLRKSVVPALHHVPPASAMPASCCWVLLSHVLLWLLLLGRVRGRQFPGRG